MIIDFHNHIGKSLDGAEADIERIIQNCRENGVDKAVVFATDEADMEATFQKPNTRVFEAAAKFPETIIPFVRIVPSAGQLAVDEFKRCVDLGAKGLKLKAEDGFKVTDVCRIFDLIEEDNSFPVVVHTSHYDQSRPSDWQPITKKYPHINFVFAHGGKDLYRKTAVIVAEDNNLFVDVTTLSLYRTRYLYEHLGPNKIIFASDYPYSHPTIEIEKFSIIVNDLGSLKEAFSQNAARLLGL